MAQRCRLVEQQQYNKRALQQYISRTVKQEGSNFIGYHYMCRAESRTVVYQQISKTGEEQSTGLSSLTILRKLRSRHQAILIMLLSVYTVKYSSVDKLVHQQSRCVRTHPIVRTLRPGHQARLIMLLFTKDTTTVMYVQGPSKLGTLTGTPCV